MNEPKLLISTSSETALF